MPGEGMSNQLSNVLGVAIPYDLKRQLYVRSEKLGASARSTNDIQYLANKSCWVRLVSSVKIKDLTYFKRYFPNIDLKDGDSLAKKFVLFAGTSEYTKSQLNDNGFQYNIRSGFGTNGSYGMLGDVETQLYGYKPMPGITDARIETQGKLGSIRSATINFKAWDKAQLDIIDALYFKLGYTMFLEWGHTTYFDNGDGLDMASPKLQRSDLKQIDPFTDNLKKEIILREIATRIDESNGNYDAMLGMCTNFNFSMNEDGGYDCTIKVIGLGELASQIKINQSNALPGILNKEIKELVDIYTKILREKARQERLAKERELAAQKEAQTPPEPKYPINSVLQSADPNRYGNGGELTKELINDDSILPEKYSVTTAYAQFYAKYPNFTNTAAIISGGTVTQDAVKEYNAIVEQEKKDNLKSLDKYGDVLYNYSNTPPSGVAGIGKGLYSKTFGVYIPTEAVNIPKFISSVTLDGSLLKEAFNFFNTANVNKYFKVGDEYVFKLDDEFVFKGASSIYNTWFGIKFPSGRVNVLRLEYRIPDIDYPDNVNKKLQILRAIIDDFMLGNDRQVPLDKFSYEIDTDSRNNQLKISVKDGSSFAGGKYDVKTNNANPNATQRFQIQGISLLSTKTTKEGDVTTGTQVTAGTETKDSTEEIHWTLFFNDSSFIKDIQPAANQGYIIESKVTAENPSAASAANPEDQINLDASSIQAQEKLNYQSGLESFIRAIQLHSFNIGLTSLGVKDGKIGVVNLADPKKNFLKDLFSNGVLKNVITDFSTDKIKTYRDLEKEDTAIKLMQKYASYGFNHNLMAQSKKSQKSSTEVSPTTDKSKIPQVDFKELYKSYVVPYSTNQGIAKDIDINFPVYIKLGFLLMTLNHMCTIYDSKDGETVKVEEQTPLIYIDFNPDTNFCLSEPLQLSSDPLKMLIPFRGTDEEYARLFDPKVIENGKIKAPSDSKESKDLFKPQSQDYLSSQLPAFKDTSRDTDAYSGKIMNILLSCDYILSLCKNFANNDQYQSVKLRPFLQQIIDDINKYLGGINLLRLAYDDKSNCLYIVDDQVQPMSMDEKSIPNDKVNSEIPVFGKKSIARSLEIKTDVSSKLSNMIAISANSNIKSDASQDGTPFGHFNDNFTDRFIPQTLSINTSNTSTKNKKKSETNDAEIAAATAFNEFVKCALNTGQVSDSSISAATNYYIDRMTKRKGENPGTESSAMIPISVNFSTDGISGLSIGHAFLLPKEVLPASYEQKTNSGNIIGFVVTGLNHSIQNNTWITEVKANMMYLKDDGSFKAQERSYNTAQLSSGNFVIVPVDYGGSSGNVSSATAGNYKTAKTSALSTNDEDEAIFRWAVGTEGTILYIQWDIANWRTGHGSGTITLEDSGKVITLDARKSQWPSGLDRAAGKLIYTDIGNDVETNGQQFPNGKIWNPKMSGRSQAGIITQADADADLKRRIKEDFKPKTINTLKSRGIEWNSLSLAVKVAMVKACYGYGTVPQFMTDAYKSGGQSNLASVLLAKSQVPNNSDYGAAAAAYLLT